jgi:hypothetical protein
MLWRLVRWLLWRPTYRYQIVFGSSFATVDEAAREAELQVNQLAVQGWEAISIGAGGRAAGGAGSDLPGLGQGQVVDVVVLMRG